MAKPLDIVATYNDLFKRFGPQHWWPAESAFEVMAGAILTQNTSWTNVEKAIINLKSCDALNPAAIARISERRLAQIIRPSGFPAQKGARLKALSRYLIERHRGDIGRMRQRQSAALRQELLDIDGIGPETADAILLYALGKPAFVIDAYTRRIFSRHGSLAENAPYQDWQQLFTGRLPRSARIYNEYHALIVQLAKTHCRKVPKCGECPLHQPSTNNEQ